MRNIYPYRLTDGTEKLQVRVRVSGRRVSIVCDDYDAAIKERNRLEEARLGKHKAPLPEPKPRGGSSPRRTVTSFIRDEWWPTVVPTREGLPTRGRARGKAGAKQLPLAQRTRDNYKGLLKNWIFPFDLGSMDPAEVDAQDITEWMSEIRTKGASESNIRQALKLLSNAFGWGATMPRKTGINGNPVTSAAWPAEVREKEPEYFEFETTEWIRQLILHTAPARDERSRRRKTLLFSLMQGTAMRPEEARRIEAAHVGEHFLTLPARISKTGRERVIPLWSPTYEEAASFIEDYELRPSDSLIAREDGRAMSFTGWQKWRREVYNPARDWVADHVGDKRLKSAVVYDVCRHRWARAQLAALMPPQDVAQAMGHDLATLARVYAGPITDANERRRLGKGPYAPEAELIAARKKVEAEIPEALEKARRLAQRGTPIEQVARELGFGDMVDGE